MTMLPEGSKPLQDFKLQASSLGVGMGPVKHIPVCLYMTGESCRETGNVLEVVVSKSSGVSSPLFTSLRTQLNSRATTTSEVTHKVQSASASEPHFHL